MHGLTKRGRAEVALQAQTVLTPLLQSETHCSNAITIVSSPFLRTRQTAEIIQQTVQTSNSAIIVHEALRERYFGDFEGHTAHDSYNNVWQEDETLVLQSSFNCESVESVWARTTELITELDRSAPQGGHCFILVSHGDAIQITRAKLWGVNPRLHRQMEHVHPAQIIKL